MFVPTYVLDVLVKEAIDKTCMETLGKDYVTANHECSKSEIVMY